MNWREVYLRTTYVAGALRIRIGQPVALLEPWAFVSAWNPGSLQLPSEENARRARALEEEVGRSWRFERGAGVPDDPQDWAAEESLLIHGISRDEAVALGRRYGQNAIVAGAGGGPAELIFCA